MRGNSISAKSTVLIHPFLFVTGNLTNKFLGWSALFPLLPCEYVRGTEIRTLSRWNCELYQLFNLLKAILLLNPRTHCVMILRINAKVFLWPTTYFTQVWTPSKNLKLSSINRHFFYRGCCLVRFNFPALNSQKLFPGRCI